jgi:hypothetical protein
VDKSRLSSKNSTEISNINNRIQLFMTSANTKGAFVGVMNEQLNSVNMQGIKNVKIGSGIGS